MEFKKLFAHFLFDPISKPDANFEPHFPAVVGTSIPLELKCAKNLRKTIEFFKTNKSSITIGKSGQLQKIDN